MLRQITLIAALTLLSGAGSIHAQQGATPAEQYLFQQTNQHRAEHSLPPLAWDPALARAAHAHALLIQQNQGPALHQYPGEPDMKTRAVQAGAHFSTISENVAGNANTPNDLDKAWMNSPVHRANILSPDHNSIGIAVVADHGILYAVEDFSHAATVLSTSRIEQQALDALRKQGITPATSAEAQNAAREACANPNSTAGNPLIIMQWDGPDLTQIPAALLKQMPTATQHTVAVGACPSNRQSEGFTTYHVAVLVFK